MKTWTNPTVEELDVKLTANGFHDWEYETLGGWIEDEFGVKVWVPDLPIANDSNKEKNPS